MQPSICTFHRPRGHACRDSAGIPIFLSLQIWNGKWKVFHSFPSTICKAVIQVPNSCNWIRLKQDFSDESLVRSWRWRCLWSLERRQHMVPLRTCRLDNIGQTSASTELWISMDCCPLLSNIFQYEIFKQIYKATADYRSVQALDPNSSRGAPGLRTGPAQQRRESRRTEPEGWPLRDRRARRCSTCRASKKWGKIWTKTKTYEILWDKLLWICPGQIWMLNNVDSF
jgi:hypothetical protein